MPRFTTRISAAAGDVSIEDVRAYWDRRPCNIGHSTQPVGTREYFDEVEARRYFVEPHIPRFAQFERWKGKNVLEVGCGIGTDAVNFARAGAHYTGVELSPTSMNVAKARFTLFGLEGEFVSCNAERMSSYLSGTFDFVYAFGTIHHSPHQRALVEEIRKLVKRDGEFRCMLYARNSWKAIMIEAGLDQPEAQSGCPIATTYSHHMINNLLSGLFQIVSIEKTHIFPYVVEKYVNFEYEKHPWFRVMPKDVFSALERRLGWHWLVVARPIDNAGSAYSVE
jgi:ubiquinone/menaquinone biosynthesis C-methylase UbiE